MSSIEILQTVPMEEADSGESDSPMESERSEDRAQRSRGPPGSREDISRAGAELTEAEQAMQVSSELPRDVTARAPSASIPTFNDIHQICTKFGALDALVLFAVCSLPTISCVLLAECR